MSTFNRDRAAAILVEAAYRGDKHTAKHHAISDRTLRSWRARLETDQELAALFLQKNEQATRDWAEEVPLVIRAAMEYIRRAAIAGKSTPEMVHAVAGAMKLLAEMQLTKKVIDARLTHQYRPASAADREVAAFSAN